MPFAMTMRRIGLAGLIAAPGLAALAALALAERISPWPFILAAGFVLGAALILVSIWAQRIDRLIAGLAADGPEEDLSSAAGLPTGKAGLWRMPFPELDGAIGRAADRSAESRYRFEATAGALEAVFASLPDPLFMLDSERRVLRANPAAVALVAGSPVGRDLTEILRNPAIFDALGAIQAGEASRVVDFTLPVPVGRRFTARIERLPLVAADGTVAILILHDLTALERADQMRVDFVANVSHELRTPLSTLIGFVETLQGPARDDRDAQDRFLKIMHDQALRMARLVADLLSLSRIELNEHTPPKGRVVLNDVLRAVVDGLEMKARERGMVISLSVEQPPAVVGDADELTQVFQNLVDNAIKYGRANSSVRILARPIGNGDSPIIRQRLRDGAEVAVRDEGEGIAREHLPRLTERFYRVDNARSRALGGTGLGLAIVKHIVNRHRGHLDIASTPGQGSIFTVYLPAFPGKG